MNLKIIITIFLFTGIASFCNKPKEWQIVEFTESLKCDRLYSKDANHNPIKCRAYFENDTLMVFLSDLSLPWGYITLQIHDQQFKAEFEGTSPAPVTLSFETINQQFQAGKRNYAINDTLCGKFDLSFRFTDANTNKTENWKLKGSICEVIRQKDFDPFLKDNFMNFDLETAIHEIGKPLEQSVFSMIFSHGLRIGLLNYFPQRKDIVIKELTWDISPVCEINEGEERLTVWYAALKDKPNLREDRLAILPEIWENTTADSSTWIPIHYYMWNIYMQF